MRIGPAVVAGVADTDCVNPWGTTATLLRHSPGYFFMTRSAACSVTKTTASASRTTAASIFDAALRCASEPRQYGLSIHGSLKCATHGSFVSRWTRKPARWLDHGCAKVTRP